MSFCRRSHKNDNPLDVQSFPKQVNKEKKINEYDIEAVPQNSFSPKLRLFGKKTSLCSRHKGSYTLEAAVIIPILAFFFVTILFFFRVLQVQTQVQEALDYAGRKTACVASSVSPEAGLFTSAEGYFRKELEQYPLTERFVKGGRNGVTLLQSDMKDNYVSLQASYYMKVPVSFFTVKGVMITQGSRSRKWTGDRTDGTTEDYVYVTEHGKVYHRDRKCHYLDLSIQTVNIAQIKGLRNKDGHKYYACSDCVVTNSGKKQVFITDYGTCYHDSLSCSGLKRTIYLIPISEVGGRGPCSKCG